MKPTIENMTMRLNTKNDKFEFQLEGNEVGYIEFSPAGRKMYLKKTLVPASIRGKGYGKMMAESALNAIDKMRFKVIPECSFIEDFISKNPKYQNLVYETGG